MVSQAFAPPLLFAETDPAMEVRIVLLAPVIAALVHPAAETDPATEARIVLLAPVIAALVRPAAETDPAMEARIVLLALAIAVLAHLAVETDPAMEVKAACPVPVIAVTVHAHRVLAAAHAAEAQGRMVATHALTTRRVLRRAPMASKIKERQDQIAAGLARRVHASRMVLAVHPPLLAAQPPMVRIIAATLVLKQARRAVNVLME